MPTLIHAVTALPRDTWNLLVAHPVATIPGTILLLGAMIVAGRKNRSRKPEGA